MYYRNVGQRVKAALSILLARETLNVFSMQSHIAYTVYSESTLVYISFWTEITRAETDMDRNWARAPDDLGCISPKGA